MLERKRGESLGLNIKGGKEYRCGIFVSAVDQGGQAQLRVRFTVDMYMYVHVCAVFRCKNVI